MRHKLYAKYVLSIRVSDEVTNIIVRLDVSSIWHGHNAFCVSQLKPARLSTQDEDCLRSEAAIDPTNLILMQLVDEFEVECIVTPISVLKHY